MDNYDKILELITRAQHTNLSELRKNLYEILKAHGYLIQSLYELQPSLQEGEVYIETLINKLIFTSNSVVKLSNGWNFEILGYNDKIEAIDIPSIYILTRSII